MAGKQTNFEGASWSEEEVQDLVKLAPEMTWADVAKELNKKYHRGKRRQRTAGACMQRYNKTTTKPSKRSKRSKLARRTAKPETVVVNTDDMVPVEAFRYVLAIQTPDIKGSIQIEGKKASNALLKRLADDLVKSL
jgi:hypothetical protein